MMKPVSQILVGIAAIAAPAFSQETDQQRMDAILREFDRRDYGGSSGVQQHKAWAGTDQGRDDLVFLAAHYDGLSDMRKQELPMELARTGKPAVVPLVKRALEDPQSKVLSGVFYACRLGGFEPEYGKRIAPSLVPLLGKRHLGQDRALDLLPTLDPELAGKTLFNDAWLSPAAPDADDVIRAFNDAHHPVPVEWLVPLVEKWRALALADSVRKGQRAYGASLVALARIRPGEATARTEEWITRFPQESEEAAEVFLVANGLDRLRDSLIDRIDTPKDLDSLPEAAGVFFSISIFEADCMNGGISQAFWNSTGDFIPWVRKGYRLIGDDGKAKYMDKVCAPFGETGPSTNREMRNRQMETMRPTFDELAEKWEEEEDPADPGTIPTEILLGRYVAQHADVLRPLVENAPE